MLDGGEVVEALLYEEADDPVGVEDEVSALRVLVADDSTGASEPMRRLARKGNYSREQRDQLGRLREDGDGFTFHTRRDHRSWLLRAVVGPDTGFDVGHCRG